MVDGKGCGEDCLGWPKVLFFLFTHWQSPPPPLPRVLKECIIASFSGESKGTAVGLVRCQSVWLPTWRHSTLRLRWETVFHLPLNNLDRCSTGSPY